MVEAPGRGPLSTSNVQYRKKNLDPGVDARSEIDTRPRVGARSEVDARSGVELYRSPCGRDPRLETPWPRLGIQTPRGGKSRSGTPVVETRDLGPRFCEKQGPRGRKMRFGLNARPGSAPKLRQTSHFCQETPSGRKNGVPDLIFLPAGSQTSIFCQGESRISIIHQGESWSRSFARRPTLRRCRR